jgi:hypothetical protein
MRLTQEALAEAAASFSARNQALLTRLRQASGQTVEGFAEPCTACRSAKPVGRSEQTGKDQRAQPGN